MEGRENNLHSKLVKVKSSQWFLSTRKVLVGIVLFMSPGITFSQSTVKGSVLGSRGLPLENASIYNLTQNTGVTTAPDGTFTVNATYGDTLEISFIGYLPQSIIIQDAASPVTVRLLENAIDLDQVVVLGYTSQKVKETTGSIATVKTKDLTAIPAGQVGQMLQGRVAGLNVISSGEPGTPINIYMRGLGNFGDVTPLYIIDGLQGDINSLNPNDIESLQVLKDAGAYSIYGVRGANGVIVITTKKGREGQAKLEYSTYLGYTRPLKNGFDLLTPQENAELLWIALKNAGQVDANGNPSDRLYGNGPVPVLPDYLTAGPHVGLFEGDPRVDISKYNIDPSTGPVYQNVPFNKSGTDWFHELFQPAWSQNHALTISGRRSLYRFTTK